MTKLSNDIAPADRLDAALFELGSRLLQQANLKVAARQTEATMPLRHIEKLKGYGTQPEHD